jgi:hypothetical protein
MLADALCADVGYLPCSRRACETTGIAFLDPKGTLSTCTDGDAAFVRAPLRDHLILCPADVACHRS